MDKKSGDEFSQNHHWVIQTQQKRLEELENQLAYQKLQYAELVRVHRSLLNSRLGKISNWVSRGLSLCSKSYHFLKPSHFVRLIQSRIRRSTRRKTIIKLQSEVSPIVDIVLPVYRGLDETRNCLNELFRAKQKNEFEIVVIDDQSPEPELVDFLTKMEGEKRITLLKNETNLGFVGTVNRGMKLHPDRDVILLNSDTEAVGDWVDRMRVCAYSDPLIGSVTPFSNNATICSYPHFCKENLLPPGETVGTLDEMFSDINRGQPGIEIPTAVGFCMYIKRACLDDTGLFDQETFGLGYGEENDFCMRAHDRGWRHVLSPDVFVYHAGGVSFSDVKQELMNRAMRVLSARYPMYHLIVHRHIKEDPAAALRQAVSLQRLKKNDKPRFLFISHGGIGGVERHMVELVGLVKDQCQVLFLEPGKKGEVRLTWASSQNEMIADFKVPSQYDMLVQTLKDLQIKRIHIHHTMDIHPCLWTLVRDLAVPHDYTLHDYYPLFAEPKMVGSDCRWVGSCDQWMRQCQKSANPPWGMTLDEFRKRHLELLETADRVFAPSRFTASIYMEIHPNLSIISTGHPDLEGNDTLPKQVKTSPVQGPMRVLIIGALGPEKGADLLEACARLCLQRGYPIEFHLLGYAYRDLDPCVVTHGSYREEDLIGLARALLPQVIWFPALWPETYSYTLSAALELKLPIVAPDIGAFPERLEGRVWTWIQPWDQSVEDWVQLFDQIRTDLLFQGNKPAERPDSSVSVTVSAQEKGRKQASFSYSEDYLRLDNCLQD